MTDVLRIRRRALGGAAGAPASLAVGELAFNEVDGGLYIGRSNVASSFGAAGALIVLLLWIFYSAQIFLLGAEFTRAWARVWGSRSGFDSPGGP